MLMKEVLLKYHGRVPFPWTPAKIKKAGFDPAALMIKLGADLGLCTDSNSKLTRETLAAINKIKI